MLVFIFTMGCLNHLILVINSLQSFSLNRRSSLNFLPAVDYNNSSDWIDYTIIILGSISSRFISQRSISASVESGGFNSSSWSIIMSSSVTDKSSELIPFCFILLLFWTRELFYIIILDINRLNFFLEV